jgi:glutathione synthase/RimK-type ligase-like ATP-grasp enzyme
VFAVAIDSQRDPHARHDWRHSQRQRLPFVPHRLPPEIESRCIALVERLQLSFGAIDMILTPDGRYVFIEINPNGEYDWIEHKTALPITDAICDLLLSHERHPARCRQGGQR